MTRCNRSRDAWDRNHTAKRDGDRFRFYCRFCGAEIEPYMTRTGVYRIKNHDEPTKGKDR
jgi:hypothetical protein